MQATRKLRLDFPLERIAEPVVTKLVTEYDIMPNLLRADVDAATGGWLILEVSGDGANITSAVDWLRGHGVSVADTE